MKKHALVRPNSKLRYFKHGAQIAIHIKYCNLDFGCFYASYVQTQEQQASSSPALSAQAFTSWYEEELRESVTTFIKQRVEVRLTVENRCRKIALKFRTWIQIVVSQNSDRHARNVSSTHLQAPLGHGMDRDASISRVGLPLPEIRPENQELAGGLMLRQLRTTCSLLSRIFDVLVCLK